MSEYSVDFSVLSSKVAVHDEQIRGLARRVDNNDEMVKGVHQLAANVAVYTQKAENLVDTMETRMNILEERQAKQGERIGHLESKPGRQWEKFTGAIVAALVSGLVGALIGYFISAGA